MADQPATATPSKLGQLATKTAEATRHGLWKFFGALFMETKDGVQAVSLHRLLALSTYVACMWLWLGVTGGTVAPEVDAALKAANIDVPTALQGAAVVPDAMLYTLWALLGINGASKVVGVFKGGSNGSSQPDA
jgi:hypothetical protein